MKLKHWIQNTLYKLGWDIRRVNYYRYDNFNENTIIGSAIRIKKLRIPIKTFIDIGASNGEWTKMMLRYFPSANYFLVEAFDFHRNELAQLKKKNKRVDYLIGACGDQSDKIYFIERGKNDGWTASKPDKDFKSSLIPQYTVDHLVKVKQLEPPLAIKIDVHNREKIILDYAPDTLKKTEVLIIEAYNFPNYESIHFHNLCEYLETLNFKCIDIVDVLRRPTDRFFFQMDMVFINKRWMDELNNFKGTANMHK